MSASRPEIKASAKLPAIVAILRRRDSGEFGNANCPHCGADGRYVYTFLCEDGLVRGAMQGCLKLFPRAKNAHHAARLVAEAFKREQEARENNRPLAAWWKAMVAAAQAFQAAVETEGFSRDRLNAFYIEVLDWERKRQAWLSKKGYTRKRW